MKIFGIYQKKISPSFRSNVNRIWDSAPKYAIVCIIIFLLINGLGFELEDRLHEFIGLFTLPGLEFLRNSSTIYTLWLGALSVHAAVGAVAPILGYTLLTTNISSASRIVPGGAVVASEIRWSKYLRNSLGLLAGSLSGLLLAPSAVGFAAAACATIYVIVRTLSVFKEGFDLIERPEKFDASARKYLVNAIVGVAPTSPAVNVEADLQALNNSLNSLVPQVPYGYVPRATLRLGDPYRATQFLRASLRAVETLISEAERSGYRLLRIGDSLSIRVPRGRRDCFALERLPRAISGLDKPPEPLIIENVESAVVEKLQRVLEESISYGQSLWIDDLSRMPMLVQRHVATVIYEAIPNQQPHDLAYGLDVLGQIIDTVSDKYAKAIASNEYEWIYGVPEYLTNQINCSEHSRFIYARNLSSFLRGRIVRWLDRSELDEMSSAYIGLLAKILIIFARREPEGAEYIAMVIREIPVLVRSKRMQALLLIQRDLILALVDKQISSSRYAKERELIIRAISEAIRYSFGYERVAVVHAETLVSVLAVSMFLAEENQDYKFHVEEIIKEIFEDSYSDLPFLDLMALISEIDEVNEKWRWSWWELDQRERGRAHFMSMPLWLTRATAVALSSEAWRFRHFTDEELPSEQNLGSIIRVVREDEWTYLLPERRRHSIKAMLDPLDDLLRRRQRVVRNRVALAPLNIEKAKKFISDQMNEVAQAFGRHNEWLQKAGVVSIEDREDSSHQAGVVRLLPREWFVADDVLDIPIYVTGMQNGSALVDFEIRKIAEVVQGIAEIESDVMSASDQRIWSRVKGLVDSGVRHILIVGIDASEYDVYQAYGEARRYANEHGADIRFDSVRAAKDGKRKLIVIDVARAVALVRRRTVAQDEVIEGQSLPLEQGGVVVQLVTITDAMRNEWLKDKEQAKAEAEEARYRESVLSRNIMSVEIIAREVAASMVFIVSRDEEGDQLHPLAETVE